MAAQTMRVEGLREAVEQLRGIPDKVRKRVLQKAIRAGGSVLVREAKKTVPTDAGNLKRSLDQKVKSYQSGKIAVSIIGQRKGQRASAKVRHGRGGLSRKGYAVPIHLVENPTKPHRIPKEGKGPLVMRLPSGRQVIVESIQHPGTAGHAFLRAAAERAQELTASTVAAKMQTEIDREVRRV